MKTIKNIDKFWIGCIFGLSISFVIFCFYIANANRVRFGIGTEVFTIVLPLLIWSWNMWANQRDKREQRRLEQSRMLHQNEKNKKKFIKELYMSQENQADLN